MAMVMMASGAFHAGHPEVAEIQTAYHTLTPLLGIGAAGVFLLSLIASGISSSTVGTMAGQLIMQGFIRIRIPIWVRRLVTMIPAFVVVGLGADATNALVISQVVLSIALPLPMIALLIFTRRSDIMGQFTNGRLTNIAAIVGTAVVLGLNVFLILQTFGVPIPACLMGANRRRATVVMEMTTRSPDRWARPGLGAIMKRLLVAGVSLIVLAGRAAADDIMMTKAPAIPYAGPSAYNWSGFYAGGRVGYAWGTSNWTSNTPGAPNVSGALDLFQPLDAFKDTGSFSQGLQAGYNYMLPNRILVGAEADVTFPGFPNSAGISIGGASNLTSPTLGAETFSETVLTSGTVRGRIGYAPGNWLFYATGGFAWTYNKLSLTQLANGTTESPFLWRPGWAAGAGVEVAVAPHWTARLEYLFTGYGNSSTPFFAGAQRIDSNFALQELRAGLNYQLGTCTAGADGSQSTGRPRSYIVNFHGQTTFLEQAIRRFTRPIKVRKVCPAAGKAAKPRTLRCLLACGYGGARNYGSTLKSTGVRARQHARCCRISEWRSLQSQTDLSLCAIAARIHSTDYRPGRRNWQSRSWDQ